jgi:outer membrane lipoprotein SlyB
LIGTPISASSVSAGRARVVAAIVGAVEVLLARALAEEVLDLAERAQLDAEVALRALERGAHDRVG